MDDRSIAWMISGGFRTETLDQRHQRLHRAALAARARERETQGWGDRAAALRARFQMSLGRLERRSTSATPDCCPA